MSRIFLLLILIFVKCLDCVRTGLANAKDSRAQPTRSSTRQQRLPARFRDGASGTGTDDDDELQRRLSSLASSRKRAATKSLMQSLRQLPAAQPPPPGNRIRWQPPSAAMDEDVAEISAPVEVDRIVSQQEMNRQRYQKRATVQAISEQDVEANVNGRPTSYVLANYEHDARAAQQMFAQLSGFDVNGQAFGDAPTFAAINPTTISAAMDGYQRAMNPSMSISACASCGMLALNVPLDEVDLTGDMLAMLRLSDEVIM
jgi:hypothetical protein